MNLSISIQGFLSVRRATCTVDGLFHMLWSGYPLADVVVGLVDTIRVRGCSRVVIAGCFGHVIVASEFEQDMFRCLDSSFGPALLKVCLDEIQSEVRLI